MWGPFFKKKNLILLDHQCVSNTDDLKSKKKFKYELITFWVAETNQLHMQGISIWHGNPLNYEEAKSLQVSLLPLATGDLYKTC